jgi:mannosyltransferase OCH1-like enzyme
MPGGIPRVFHRIWLGSAIPATEERYGRAWTELNPGWEMRTWREWNLPAFRNQAWFDRNRSHAGRSDIARFELLYRFGGVYLDTDFEPLRPIEPLIAETAGFLAAEDDQWLAAAIFGAAPRHPFVGFLVDGIDTSMSSDPSAPPNEQTGPKYVTRRWHEYLATGGSDVALFPANLFYPYHFSEPERDGEDFPDAYAVHHWANSWSSG